jgi:hypothetical protein
MELNEKRATSEEEKNAEQNRKRRRTKTSRNVTSHS